VGLSKIPDTGSASVQDIELFTCALSGITIIVIPDKEPNTGQLNSEHLATLLSIIVYWLNKSAIESYS